MRAGTQGVPDGQGRGPAAAPGVTATVATRVAEGVVVTGDAGGGTVRLVVADARRDAALLDAAPLAGAHQLHEVAASPDAGDAGGAEPSPVLLRTAQPALLRSRELRVVRGGGPHPVRVVGVAPGSAGEDVLAADARSLTAVGLDAVPGTVLVTGPGAQRAAAEAGLPAGSVRSRAAALRERQTAPIAAALSRLAVVSTAVLVVLGGLDVVLGAAAGSRERGVTLARLRTLGLRRRERQGVTRRGRPAGG